MTDVLLLADIPSTGYLVGTAAQRVSGRSRASEETGRFIAHLDQRLAKSDAVIALYPSWQADGAKRLLRLARGLIKTDRIAGIPLSLPPLALSLVADQVAYLAPYLQPGHLASVAQNLANAITAGAWTRSVTKLEHIDTKMGDHLASYLPNETFIVTAAPTPAIHRIAGHKIPDIGYRPAAPIHLLITPGDAPWFQEGLQNLLRPGAVKAVPEQPLGFKFWGSKKYIEFVAFSGHPSALSHIANATRCWQCRWCGQHTALHACAFCGMSQERNQAAGSAPAGWTPTPAVTPRPALPAAKQEPPAAPALPAAPAAAQGLTAVPNPPPQQPQPAQPALPAAASAPPAAAPPGVPMPTPTQRPDAVPVQPPGPAPVQPAAAPQPPQPLSPAAHSGAQATGPGVPQPAPQQPGRQVVPLASAPTDRRVAGGAEGSEPGASTRTSVEPAPVKHKPQYAAPERTPGASGHRPAYAAPPPGATQSRPQPQPQGELSAPAAQRGTQHRPPYAAAPPSPPPQTPQQAAQELRGDRNWNGRNSTMAPTGSRLPGEGLPDAYGQGPTGQIASQYPSAVDTVRETTSAFGQGQPSVNARNNSHNWAGRNQGQSPPRPTQPNGHPQGRVSP